MKKKNLTRSDHYDGESKCILQALGYSIDTLDTLESI